MKAKPIFQETVDITIPEEEGKDRLFTVEEVNILTYSAMTEYSYATHSEWEMWANKIGLKKT